MVLDLFGLDERASVFFILRYGYRFESLDLKPS